MDLAPLPVRRGGDFNPYRASSTLERKKRATIRNDRRKSDENLFFNDILPFL